MHSGKTRTQERLPSELARLRRRIADLEAAVTDHKRIEEALQGSITRYRRLFETARDGIVILDAVTGQITDVNPSLTEMSGYSQEELLGKKLREIGPFKDVDISQVTFAELQGHGCVHREDLPLKTKDGRRFDVEVVSSAYLVNSMKVIQCNIRDVTERKQAEEKLKYLSTHDELTDLHNRVFFDEEMSRLDRGRQFPITVIVADVDGLKQINDRLGHAAGDEVLRRVASLLKEAFRADEVVARTGGDEFVVLLPKTDATTAEAALDRVRNKLRSHNAVQVGPRLSFSLGAATAKTSHSLVEALRQADEHMYREKVAHNLQGLQSIPHDLQLIFKHVEARLSANPGIHISRLASEFACERHLIERAVKVVKSMPFREYQQIRRLEIALQLLGEKPLLIKEIAGALGYASPKSLWRLIRTRIGRSPSNIRFMAEIAPAAKATNVTPYSTLATPEQLKSNLPKT